MKTTIIERFLATGHAYEPHELSSAKVKVTEKSLNGSTLMGDIFTAAGEQFLLKLSGVVLDRVDEVVEEGKTFPSYAYFKYADEAAQTVAQKQITDFCKQVGKSVEAPGGGWKEEFRVKLNYAAGVKYLGMRVTEDASLKSELKSEPLVVTVRLGCVRSDKSAEPQLWFQLLRVAYKH